MEKRLQELDRIIEIALDCDRGECAAINNFGAGLSEYMFELSAGISRDFAGLPSIIEERVRSSTAAIAHTFFKIRLLGIEFYERADTDIERMVKILLEAEDREGKSYRLRYERRLF